jgi:hypothetical protein
MIAYFKHISNAFFVTLPVDLTPVLKADALKYVAAFRNMVSTVFM